MEGDNGLGALRDELFGLDQGIVEALAKRMKIVGEIGEIKAASGLDVHNPKREELVLGGLCDLAQELGLDAEFVGNLFPAIFAHSRSLQEQQRVVES